MQEHVVDQRKRPRARQRASGVDGLCRTTALEENDFTIFVPTDAAFGQVNDLLKELTDDEIGRIILFHVSAPYAYFIFNQFFKISLQFFILC